MHIIFGMKYLLIDEIVRLSHTCKTLHTIIGKMGPYNNAYSSVFDLHLDRSVMENYGFDRQSLDKLLHENNAFLSGLFVTEVIRARRYYNNYHDDIKTSNMRLFVTSIVDYERVHRLLIAMEGPQISFCEEFIGFGGESVCRGAEEDILERQFTKNSFFMNGLGYLINVILIIPKKERKILNFTNPPRTFKHLNIPKITNYYRGPKELYIGCAVDISMAARLRSPNDAPRHYGYPKNLVVDQQDDD